MNTKRRRPPIFYFAVILAVAGLNWLAFRLYGSNYFLWYLKNGPLISLATALLAPTWTKLKARVGLVSPHPSVYVGACLQSLGFYIMSIAPVRDVDSAQIEAENSIAMGDTPFVKRLDNLVYPVIAAVMFIVSVVWVILVAPLSYFVNFIAGVPARQALRGEILRGLVEEWQGQIVLVSKLDRKPSKKPSFAQDPFAMTQALTSLLLFTANTLYMKLSTIF